jgi:hypothetical protein
MLKSWLTRLTAPLGTLSLCGAMVFFLGCSACETHVSSCSSCKEKTVSCRDCRIDTSVSLWAPDSMGGGNLASSYFDESGREFAYENEPEMGFHNEACTTCGIISTSTCSSCGSSLLINASYIAPRDEPLAPVSPTLNQWGEASY